MLEKVSIRLLLIAFFYSSVGPLPDTFAQSAIDLPAPGTMVDFSPKFNQVTLKGIIFHPLNPFKFDFILDEGDIPLNEEESKVQSQKIAAYFLASLTTPEKEIWVNLSPFERSRIVPASFGNTLMGQNLLAQDYMLKQIMATALYPERQLGREFWQKVYTQALVKFGTTNIPIDTFNKVWIVPDKAVVYENAKMNAVFVAESSLKVMLEKDYLAQSRHSERSRIDRHPQLFGEESKGLLRSFAIIQDDNFKTSPNVLDSVASTMSAAVIKELVVPALEKEVNEGKNFAPLRQVYNALILAKWYKDNLRNNVIAKGYVDRNKIAGVDSQDKQMVSEIYRQYLKAYKKGVFNYIKEDFDEASQSVVPRKYFSGGFMGKVNYVMTRNGAMVADSFKSSRRFFIATLVAGPAMAQDVRKAMGVPPAGDIPIPLSREEALSLLNIIKNAQNNPRAAAEALRRMGDALDPSAAKLAAEIVKERSKPQWDRVFNSVVSNTNGPGVNLPGGPTEALTTTNQFALDLMVSAGRTIRQKYNVGDSSLRYEAALYLERVAGQIKASNSWEKLFKTGGWEALNIPNEPDPMVKAAHLAAQAAFIKAHKESRIKIAGIGNNNIANLDKVFQELQSPQRIVRWSALMVFEAIQQNDPDTEYKNLIGKSLELQAGQLEKSTNDSVEFFEKTGALALRHGQKTVLPSVMDGMANYFNRRPSVPNDTEGLKNWHEHMQALMGLATQLSNGNIVQLRDYLDAQNKSAAISGETLKNKSNTSICVSALWACLNSLINASLMAA